MPTAKKRILLITTGGDAPGLNGIIRSFVLAATREHIEVYGGRFGFEKLLDGEDPVRLTKEDVLSILPLGGTVLGASNHSNPYEWKGKDRHLALIERLKRLGIHGVVCVGGEGSLEFMQRLSLDGLPSILIPKTIDNDLPIDGDTTGFWSAVEWVTDGLDNLRKTAESHDRVAVVEVMGRASGYLALYSGIAGGADAILIPEIPFDLKRLAKRLNEQAEASMRLQKKNKNPFFRPSCVIAVAEGVSPRSKKQGQGESVFKTLEPLLLSTFSSVRFTRLGHLQRGCPPRAFDRFYGTLFGAYAVELVLKNKWDRILVNRGHHIGDVLMHELGGDVRKVFPLDDGVRYARKIGILFGDE